MDHWLRISTGSNDVAIDPEVGNVRRFCVEGHEILHTAHWVGTPAAQHAESVIDAHLAGDFFCAPFGKSDILDDPPHGYSANSTWHLLSRAQDGKMATMKLALDRPIMGARLTKELVINADHNCLYQRHVFSGGQGALPLAHHPMIRVSPGDHIGYSAKKSALTTQSIEPNHILAYPARAQDLTQFPRADGGKIDLTHYPRDVDHEDFVTLIEKTAMHTRGTRNIGWTAVSRAAQDDIVIFLKDAVTFPVTMLWMSNGGRDYAPWDGRHHGILGVEDGCAAGADGHNAALGDNAITREGVPSAVTLGGTLTFNHAILVLKQPDGWDGVAQLKMSSDRIDVVSPSGLQVSSAFNAGFFDI